MSTQTVTLPSSNKDSADGEVLVKVDGVGKRFCRDLMASMYYGLQDVGNEFLGKSSSDVPLRKQEFWANQDISFELRRGECLGLIGKNGAGKTTLLKMLNGLIRPDKGRIEMRGRVGALIALGAGFNPILTGRENVFIAGSVLGLSRKEIGEKYDAIVDFAGLHDFMGTPVQNYSSGMQVRLGFAVASAMNPDVLLVDEVLAVGDAAFKVRCYNRIREILPETAVVLVSHNMGDIARACTRVMVLKGGKSHYIGNPEEGIHTYNCLNEENSGQTESQIITHMSKEVASVSDIEIQTRCDGLNTDIDFKCCLQLIEDLPTVRVRFVFFDETQSGVAEWDSIHHATLLSLEKGKQYVKLSIKSLRLRSGVYRMTAIFTDTQNKGYYVNIEYGLIVEIKNPAVAGAPYKV